MAIWKEWEIFSKRILAGLRELEPLLGRLADLGGRLPSFACSPASLHIRSKPGSALWGDTALPFLRLYWLLGNGRHWRWLGV